MEFLGQKGMVLSGIALLLVLPALLLSATFLTTVETGGELTAVQGLSDKIAHKAFDIKKTLRYRKQHGERLDRQALNELEKRYEQSSVVGDIEIDYSAFNLWVKYSGDMSHISSENVHATDNACIVKNLKKNNWTYNFEASIGLPDYDYNEPLLRLERLEGGNWKVTVAPTFTHDYANATVHWGDQVIFEHVNADRDASGNLYDGVGDARKGHLVGESKIVSEVPDTVFINIELEDPAGTVHYDETFSLRKPEEMEIEETKENLIYMNDAVAIDGPDSKTTKGGVEFSVKNKWDNTITIKNITIDPADKDINAISDEVYGNDPEDHEVSADVLDDGTVDDYVDYGGGEKIPKDGITADISVDVPSGKLVGFYLYEFYDKITGGGPSGNWDMVGEDVKITLTYELKGNQKKRTFTITPA